MDVYSLMNDMIYGNNLLMCGQQLIEFAEIVLKETNKPTLIKHFYQRLSQYIFNCVLDNDKDKNYYIFDKLNAQGMYIALTLLPQESPIKTLNKIREQGKYIITHYENPVGPIISKECLDDILKYLDIKYSFTSKVFKDTKSTFIILPNSHINYNSEYLVFNKENMLRHNFLLYHMKESGIYAPTPEAVLFHELGHALHAQYFRTIKFVPNEKIDVLNKICFPAIKELSDQEQCELFADVLSMGLMYQSPFQKYDCFTEIRPEHKLAFKNIVEDMINKL